MNTHGIAVESTQNKDISPYFESFFYEFSS